MKQLLRPDQKVLTITRRPELMGLTSTLTGRKTGKYHYDNQKTNGLTFPRTIQSAFTQKLDMEGCDPLALPLAVLMYQQANNFWLRKLAYGREVYLIPTKKKRNCCLHNGAFDAAQIPLSRPEPCLTLPSSARLKIGGQDQQH